MLIIRLDIKINIYNYYYIPADQNGGETVSEGIIWETSISTAFESARNEKKLIFIDFFSPT